MHKFNIYQQRMRMHQPPAGSYPAETSGTIFNHKKGNVLSFGELLIRLCPDASGNWLDTNKLQFYIGGAELNVSRALALWGIDIKYLTALPENALSAQLINYLDKQGIDTSSILKSGNRIGLYYLTPGEELKHDTLVYDRAGSSFATLETGMINWDSVLEDVSWFHFSAICPAISQDVADVCLEALKAAAAKNITISIDMNYRAKLWQYGKRPLEIIPELASFCDVIMGNLWAADKMLGVPVPADIHDSRAYLIQAEYCSSEIIRRFPKCTLAANTFRFDTGCGLEYFASLYTGDKLYSSKKYATDLIADKAGSGDCFMAGLIYGLTSSLPVQDTLEFATAAAFGKLSVRGDATNQQVEAIKNIIK